jgi:hypothetical protein
MKGKLLNALLLISSFFGFLEWGQNHKMFLFQIEAEIFSKIFKDPLSAVHPFIILPLLGQACLFLTLVQKNPNRILTFMGIGGIGILLALLFLIGCLNMNLKILLSTIPFLTLGYLTILHHGHMNILPPPVLVCRWSVACVYFVCTCVFSLHTIYIQSTQRLHMNTDEGRISI